MALLFFATGLQTQAQQIGTPSSCSILDFSQDTPGLVTSSSTSKGTVSIFARKRNEDGTYAAANHASIFNTLTPTGGDSDLYTEDWGNVLIINQGLGAEPNDNAWGGDITLDFSAMGPVTMTSLKALDFDVYENNSWIYLYDGAGNELHKVQIPSKGNMSQQEINLGNTKGVMKMKVVFDGLNAAGVLAGSGAIDDIRFCIEETTPPTTPPSCDIISFEKAAPGLINSYATTKGTVAIHARKRNQDGTYATENHASVFNTQSPTGDDSDLYTEDWGNALIINQDLNAEPNDNPWGGEITIDFSAIGPVSVYSLKALDFDVYEDNALVYLYDVNGEELWKARISSKGNNSKQEIYLNNIRNVYKLKVVLDGRNAAGELAGSGAIDDIKFCVEDENYVDANAGPDVFLTCTSLKATLNGASHTDGATFKWTGPNGFTSDIAKPTVTVPGTYTLTVTNPVNGATASDQVVVSIVNVIYITPYEAYLTCKNRQVQLRSATSIAANYEWTGPNGFIKREEGVLSSSIYATMPGKYTLTVTNPQTGCQATETREVTELAPPDLNVNAGPDKVVTCDVTTVTLEGSVTGSPLIRWRKAGNDLILSTSLNFNVSTPGTYVLTALDQITGCAVTDTVTISGGPAPYFEFYRDTRDNFLTCGNKEVGIGTRYQPAGVTYAWTGPNGFTSDQSYIRATAVGDYWLTVTDPVTGCQTTKYTSVSEFKLNVTVSAGPDQVLSCKNTTVTLVGSVTGTVPFIHWYTEQGQHIKFAANLVVDKPGKYVMSVFQSETGCEYTDTVEVTLDNAAPNVTAQGGTLSSETGTVQLMGTSTTEGVAYSWTGPEGYTSTEQNPVVSIAGEYTLTVTNPTNGCTATATVTVEEQAVTSTESISQVTAYPNPVKEKSKLEFRLKNADNYVVNLYDLKGNLIRELSTGHAKAEELVTIELDARTLDNGLYFARIISSSKSKTIKLLLKK
ncbi:T9SS type A sorting domain-containing protein [Pontibacter sp. KCTC 32443]|uniref:T9SS type A sorting domain-containing protein n=1 Tax=Pontibacter TaxID=323449 RepID=UPI00164D05A2|nr:MULTISPECIES: T9SS type A sorting domain-containing protein [Pontibacter]MBC5774837.1 T9SS type A sorting domain-containing protein [Pontibacter sp. KCTC 32443]